MGTHFPFFTHVSYFDVYLFINCHNSLTKILVLPILLAKYKTIYKIQINTSCSTLDNNHHHIGHLPPPSLHFLCKFKQFAFFCSLILFSTVLFTNSFINPIRASVFRVYVVAGGVLRQHPLCKISKNCDKNINMA